MGRIDGIPIVGGARLLLPLQEAINRIVFLPLEREKVIKAREADPQGMLCRWPGILKPEIVPGITMDGPVETLMSHTTLFGSKDLPNDIAYTITKTMVEHEKEYKAASHDQSVNIGAFVPTIPFHPGSVKAFKELGLWTDEIEEAQQALLSEE
jgi:TRAP-type uncharacterized transport system substrate-binding protein